MRKARSSNLMHRMQRTITKVALATVAFTSVSASIVSGGEFVPAKIHSVRLYQPDNVLRDRIGDDSKPLADFVKTIAAKVNDALSHADLGDASGALIAIGVKPNGDVRGWCQPVGGSMPRVTLDLVEKSISQVPGPPVKRGPIALALEVGVGGRTPVAFPVIPAAWQDAAKAAGQAMEVPDGVFPLIWPDPAATTRP